MGMAKLTGKNRRALLQGMKNLKEAGLVSKVVPSKTVLDRSAAIDQRKFARKAATRWLYQPTDLVRCKHWQWGEFIGTVIRVEDTYAQLLGPMGTVMVPCQSLKLIDRFEDACEADAT